jgi:hypothetical protein
MLNSLRQPRILFKLQALTPDNFNEVIIVDVNLLTGVQNSWVPFRRDERNTLAF